MKIARYFKPERPSFLSLLPIVLFAALYITQTHANETYRKEVNTLAAALPAHVLEPSAKIGQLKTPKPKKKPQPPKQDQIGQFIRGLKK